MEGAHLIQQERRHKIVFICFCMLVVVFLISGCLFWFSQFQRLQIFSMSLFHNAESPLNTIIFDFRIPKALTALIVGIALSLSGLQMQTLFRNPMAGPDVLGISSGASLGVAFVILGFSGNISAESLSRSGKLDSYCSIMDWCRSRNDPDNVNLVKDKRDHDYPDNWDNAFKRDLSNCNNYAVFQR